MVLRRFPKSRNLGMLLISVALVLGSALTGPAAASSPSRLALLGRGVAGSSLAGHDTPRARRGPAAPHGVAGIDVSHHQGTIAWPIVADQARFAYIKATEGTTYTDPAFPANYTGAYQAGLVRGAYHFALPDRSTGAAQARHFLAHGGRWAPDGQTLPPMLDLEHNPYGQPCYGLRPTQMVTWITDFSDTVHARTGRYPVLYTTRSWWSSCTGNSDAFATTHPLFLARYDTSPHPLPRGWPVYTFWQYTNTGSVRGIQGTADKNVFNGTRSQLHTLALGPAAHGPNRTGPAKNR